MTAAEYAEICGTQGMLRVEKAWNNEDQPVTLEHRTKEGVRTIDFAPAFQFTHQLRHLCDCLTAGQPHRIPPEDSVNQMRVIDALFESLATGKAVALAG